MSLLQSVAVVGHLLAVVILVGATITMAFVVVPAMDRQWATAETVRSIGQRFTILSAVSGVAVLLTGTYLTSVQHTLTSLTTTPSGWAVLASIFAWVVLAGLLTVGTGRLARAVAVGEPRRGADRSRRWYNAAVAVAIVGVAISSII